MNSEKALTDAITALSNSNLSMCEELQKSREIQGKMADTLVAIHRGQEEISTQLRHMVERQNEHEKHAHSSEGKIRAVESVLERHAARIESIEARLPEAQPATQ